MSEQQRIPFSDLMNESLYRSQVGFFNQYVAIGRGSAESFNTASMYPEYARLWALFCSPYLADHPQFVELGGGTGDFKHNFTEHLNENNIGVSYISLDLSEKFARVQLPLVVQGTSLHIPIASKSVNGIVFANELLDNVPFNVLRMRGGSPEELVFYRDGGELRASWEHPTDQTRKHYKKYFSNRNLKDGTVFTISPMQHQAVREMARILKSGLLILVDAGFDNVDLPTLSDLLGPQFGVAVDGFVDPAQIIDSLYKSDITAMVDFESIKRVSDNSGLQTVFYDRQGRFLANIIGGNKVADSGSIIYQFGSAFKVLVMKTKGLGLHRNVVEDKYFE